MSLCSPDPISSEDRQPFVVVHECPNCGMFSRLTDPVGGTDQRCPRCTKILRRVRSRPLDSALACCLAGLAFYVVAMISPLLQVFLYGRTRYGTLASGPITLDDQNYWMLATLVMLTTVLMPFIKLAGTLVVLLGLRLPHPPRWLPMLYGWLKHLNHWAMLDVFMLGFLVAYTRLHVIMYVHLGMAAYALAGLMVSVIAMDSELDPEAVWQSMRECHLTPEPDPANPLRSTFNGQSHKSLRNSDLTHKRLIGCDTCHQVCCAEEGDQCPRCGDVIRERKPNSLSRSWALTITAAILYIPSNMFPIMSLTKLGKTESYTIFQGMMELIHLGLWPLGLLVFVASIVIPCFKLIALGNLLVQTRHHSVQRLHYNTKLYRLIDFIGRWSMVDVFMVSILVALVQFGKLALVQANWGVVYFGAVVVLTMVAVNSFDPRLMWDNLEIPHPEIPPATEPPLQIESMPA